MTDQEAQKLKGFLGLCHRAGQVILGQDACIEAVRKKTAALVLLDEESSEGSGKRFRNACRSHGVPLYGVPPGWIDQALGRNGRMAAAIRHGTMAQKLLALAREFLMTDGSQPMENKNETADIAGVQARI